MKKKKVYSYLIYNIVSLSKMTAKTESFSEKMSWIWTCSHIRIKLSYWRNLLLFWMILNKAFAYLPALKNNIYTTKNSRTNIFLFIMNTRKRCDICSKLTIKTLEQRFFGFKQISVCYCSSYYQMYKNFSEMETPKKGLWSEVVVPKNIFFFEVCCF